MKKPTNMKIIKEEIYEKNLMPDKSDLYFFRGIRYKN